MNKKNIALSSILALSAAAMADKPTGFRFFDNHLTIKQYVSLSYTYDSNVDTAKHSSDDNIFLVQPGVDFEWKGERWRLTGTLFYSYNYYCEYNDSNGEHSYGESLKYQWSSVGEDGRGWNLLLSERYRLVSQSDSLTSDDGRGIWRDREQFNAAGVLERRITARWHADVSGQYDWLDYKNDTGKYAPLYGWSSYSAGLGTGYVLSKWTDLQLQAGYSHYLQKQSDNDITGRHYDSDSQSYTVMGGLGTHATERITYRVLMGMSWLDYGGVSDADHGWTYSASGNWRITRNLQWSAIGSSYYRPSERTVGSAVKAYTFSTGLSYLTLGDHMNLTADVGYRHDENVYSDYYVSGGLDTDEDYLDFRLGANYIINRWVSVFANAIYSTELSDNSNYEYDRYRGTLGLRLHY